MKITIQFAKIAFDHPTGQVMGLTTGNGKNIYIQPGLGKRKTFEVMMHELTHAAMIQLKIKRKHSSHEKIAKQVGRYAVKTAWKRRQYE